MSDAHAVVIDNMGEAYSWGSGKYGELGLDRSIYSPFPSKIISDRQFLKVWCSDLVTCFIDLNKKFCYYGVIIKIYKGSNSAITLNKLLKDESNSDPNFIFSEKCVFELESESFVNISIGNGFIGLLSEKGLVYSIDHSDNITVLFSKYFVYSLNVSSNGLYGLCKDNNKIKIGKSSTDKTIYDSNNTYLCKWQATYFENDVISDAWSTNLYKVLNDIEPEQITLLESMNKDILLLTFFENEHNKFENSSNSLFSPKETSINGDNNRYFDGDNSINNTLNDFQLSRKINNFDKQEVLVLISTFDDSYNMKYKRRKHFQSARPIMSAVVNKKKIMHVKNNSKFMSEMDLISSKINSEGKYFFTEGAPLEYESTSKFFKTDFNQSPTVKREKSIRFSSNNISPLKKKDRHSSVNSINKSSQNNTFISNQYNEHDVLRINSNINLSIKSEKNLNLISPDAESLVQFYVDSGGFNNINKREENIYLDSPSNINRRFQKDEIYYQNEDEIKNLKKNQKYIYSNKRLKSVSAFTKPQYAVEETNANKGILKDSKNEANINNTKDLEDQYFNEGESNNNITTNKVYKRTRNKSEVFGRRTNDRFDKEMQITSEAKAVSTSPTKPFIFNSNPDLENLSKDSLKSSGDINLNPISNDLNDSKYSPIIALKNTSYISPLTHNIPTDPNKNESPKLYNNTVSSVESYYKNMPLKLKENGPFLYFTKILFRIISVYFKEHKTETEKVLFHKIYKQALSNRKMVLLKKFVLKKRINNKTNFYLKWRKIAQITNSVSILNKIYIKNLNYAFYFFKHYTKVYSLKKKYFKEFMDNIESILVYRNKLKFLDRFKLRCYYFDNYDTISKGLKDTFHIITLAFKRDAMRYFKRLIIKQKLLSRNLSFFDNIITTKILKLKEVFLKNLVLNNLRHGILRELVMKKHLKRIFFLKKSFRFLKKFSMREDENIYINFKLRKLFKIYFYKQKMKLIKMLYRWNINATKKLKPKLENPMETYKLNDLRSRIRNNKIPGFHSSIPKYDRAENFVEKMKNFINKQYKSLKFDFMAKTYIYVVLSKIENLVLGVKKIVVKGHFYNLVERYASLKVKTKLRDSRNSKASNLVSSIESRITQIHMQNGVLVANSLEYQNQTYSLTESNLKIEHPDSFCTNKLAPGGKMDQMNQSTLVNASINTPKFRNRINSSDLMLNKKGEGEMSNFYSSNDDFQKENSKKKIETQNKNGKNIKLDIMDLSDLSNLSEKNINHLKVLHSSSKKTSETKRQSHHPRGYFKSHDFIINTVKESSKSSQVLPLTVARPPSSRLFSIFKDSYKYEKKNKKIFKGDRVYLDTEKDGSNYSNSNFRDFLIGGKKLEYHKCSQLCLTETNKNKSKDKLSSQQLVNMSKSKHLYSKLPYSKSTYRPVYPNNSSNKFIKQTNHRNNCAANYANLPISSSSIKDNYNGTSRIQSCSSMSTSKFNSTRSLVGGRSTYRSTLSQTVQNVTLFNKIVHDIFTRRKNQTGLELIKRMMTLKYVTARQKGAFFGLKIISKLYKRRKIFYKLRFLHRLKNINDYIFSNRIASKRQFGIVRK